MASEKLKKMLTFFVFAVSSYSFLYNDQELEKNLLTNFMTHSSSAEVSLYERMHDTATETFQNLHR